MSKSLYVSYFHVTSILLTPVKTIDQKKKKPVQLLQLFKPQNTKRAKN